MLHCGQHSAKVLSSTFCFEHGRKKYCGATGSISVLITRGQSRNATTLSSSGLYIGEGICWVMRMNSSFLLLDTLKYQGKQQSQHVKVHEGIFVLT